MGAGQDGETYKPKSPILQPHMHLVVFNIIPLPRLHLLIKHCQLMSALVCTVCKWSTSKAFAHIAGACCTRKCIWKVGRFTGGWTFATKTQCPTKDGVGVKTYNQFDVSKRTFFCNWLGPWWVQWCISIFTSGDSTLVYKCSFSFSSFFWTQNHWAW